MLAAVEEATVAHCGNEPWVHVVVDGTSLKLPDWKREKDFGAVGSTLNGARGLKVIHAYAVAANATPPRHPESAVVDAAGAQEAERLPGPAALGEGDDPLGALDLARHARPLAGGTLALPINVVDVREVGTTPRGEKPVHWRLLTNHPIRTMKDVLAVIDGYTKRWRIEELHRVWKSGALRVEETQLRSAARVIKWAILAVVTAARIERLRMLARTNPDDSALTMLSEHEIKALIIMKRRHAKRTEHVPNDTPTIGQAVRWLTDLGGYAGHASSGRPGAVRRSLLCWLLVFVLDLGPGLRWQSEQAHERLRGSPIAVDSERAIRLCVREGSPAVDHGRKRHRCLPGERDVDVFELGAPNDDLAEMHAHDERLLADAQAHRGIDRLRPLRVEHGAERQQERRRAEREARVMQRRTRRPAPQRLEDRLGLVAPRRELVDLHVRRRGHLPAHEDACRLEPFEALREDVRADPGQAFA